MKFSRIVTMVALGALAGTLPASAQAVISAKAGVVHYVEGDVTIGTGAEMTPVEPKTGGRYTEMKDGQDLATAEGRVEVLLNPGVFLRLGENSAIRMISSRLADTRVELLRGVALVEVAEVSKDNAITMLVKDTAVTFSKMGLVRLDAESGIRVYKGEVQVMADGAPQNLKDGREMSLAAGHAVAKFDAKQGDPLYRWANRRAEYIAMANIASANMARSSYGANSFPMNGGWYYNSFYGMMTYLPGTGMYRSPFGYFYYSPDRVYNYYQSFIPRPVDNGMSSGGGAGGRSWNSDNGYFTTGSRTAGAVSMGSSSVSPAASAPSAGAARGADTGTSRGGSGGRSN